MSNPFARARINMVESQIRALPLEAEGIIAAFSGLPREAFTSPESQGIAYCDSAVPMGEGRAMIAPHLLARMADAARISHTSCVLDVGAGSGYATAMLARLAGCVIGIEENSILARRGNHLLASIETDNAAILVAPHASGYPMEAPFDAIVISGGEIAKIPDSLLEQLAPQGQLVYISQGQLVAMTKTGDSFTRTVLGEAIAPPLVLSPSAEEGHNTPETVP